MNTTGLKGRLIKFIKPIEQIDFENLLPTDWQFLDLYDCPVMDGSAFDLGDNTYWMVDERGPQPLSYDPRLMKLNEDARPTNIKSETYPNYYKYYFNYITINRSKDEVKASIIAEEKLANANLDKEADVTTMNTFVQGYLAAKAEGIDPTEPQINAYNRQADVQVKKLRNADNRIDLIAQIEADNYNIDISAGWYKDDVAIGGYPFSN